MKNKRLTIIFLIGLFVTVPFLLGEIENEKDISVEATESLQEANNGKPVRVVEIFSDNISEVHSYSGTVIPKETITVGAKVSGTVNEVRKDVGDKVSKGEILLTTDVREINNGIDDIKAQIASAELAVEIQMGGLEQDKILYEKNKKLYEAGAISQVDIDKLRVKIENSEKSIAQARLNIVRLENSLEKLNIKLSDATIKSPIDGVINKRNIDAGEIIGTNTWAFEIIDMNQVYIDVEVSQGDIVNIRNTEIIDVRIPSMNNEIFTGETKYISPVADEKKFNYIARVAIVNSENLIQPGMLADVNFSVEESTDVTLVPVDAIVEKDTNKYIFIVDGDSASMIRIDTGIENEEYVEIKNEIAPGTLVVVKGQEYLEDKEKIIVVD